jgi:hypothetical protein
VNKTVVTLERENVMNTKEKIEQCLRAAPKPQAPENLGHRLERDACAAEFETAGSPIRRWFAPAGDRVSALRVAAAAVVAIAVMLPLAYGTAKVIKYFKIDGVKIIVKDSDKINTEEDARKALQEFGKLYREGKARQVKPNVWVVTLSNGEEFAYGGHNPERAGLPPAEKND